MSDPSDENPLMARLRAGLDWPNWSSWPDHSVDPVPATAAFDAESVDPAERRAEVERRRSLARTVDRGGPWLELFDDDMDGRLHPDDDAELGPLAMQTFAIKGLLAVEGHVTTAGSPVRSDAAPERATAPIIGRLAGLGAVPLGTVTLHEFAFGVTGVNPHAGTAPNPAAPGRCPGGSSSGSASAVADGSATFAIGTDTGGSVRIPSAFCGIAGFKPAHGTYPADGVFPLSPTLDHVGIHASTVAEIASIHAALGHRRAAATGPGRIGLARADLDAADPEVRDAIISSLDQLSGAGAEIVEVEWPDAESSFVASTTIMYSEAAAVHQSSLETMRDRYGDDVRSRLELGAELTGTEVAAAHRLRLQLIAEVLATLHRVDVIASPTVPIVAPLLSDADDPALPPRIVANTRLGNVVGLPAVTLPAPTDGPPVGLQLLGADNGSTLAVALAVEEVLAG